MAERSPLSFEATSRRLETHECTLAGTYSLVFFGAMRLSQFKREPRGLDSQAVWGP